VLFIWSWFGDLSFLDGIPGKVLVVILFVLMGWGALLGYRYPKPALAFSKVLRYFPSGGIDWS
jgi:hypothetical protein